MCKGHCHCLLSALPIVKIIGLSQTCAITSHGQYQGVWASKFNERAYISMRKVGLDFMDIRMAVLCQRVVPAKYAYVIHTRNPTNGDDSEVYCELVMGLGEAIVSGMPKLKIEECAARQQAMIDSGRRVIVGVNKYAPEGSEGGDVDVRRIDNTVVLEQQCAKLKALRAHRDGVAVDAALQALTEAARQRQVSANLLGLAVTAARARAG